jgi:hypothetical protein
MLRKTNKTPLDRRWAFRVFDKTIDSTPCGFKFTSKVLARGVRSDETHNVNFNVKAAKTNRNIARTTSSTLSPFIAKVNGKHRHWSLGA